MGHWTPFQCLRESQPLRFRRQEPSLRGPLHSGRLCSVRGQRCSHRFGMGHHSSGIVRELLSFATNVEVWHLTMAPPSHEPLQPAHLAALFIVERPPNGHRGRHPRFAFSMSKVKRGHREVHQSLSRFYPATMVPFPRLRRAWLVDLRKGERARPRRGTGSGSKMRPFHGYLDERVEIIRERSARPHQHAGGTQAPDSRGQKPRRGVLR